MTYKEMVEKSVDLDKSCLSKQKIADGHVV